MFIFSRKKHPLPKFPPTIASTFKMLCEDLDEAGVSKLKKAVQDSRDLALQRETNDPKFNKEGAFKLADCSDMLLDKYKSFSRRKRALITGAVRYFAVANDPISDEDYASGLWDDMRVMNYVLEQLGIESYYFDV